MKIVNQAVSIQPKSVHTSNNLGPSAAVTPKAENSPPKLSGIPPIAPSANVSNSTDGFSGFHTPDRRSAKTATKTQKAPKRTVQKKPAVHPQKDLPNQPTPHKPDENSATDRQTSAERHKKSDQTDNDKLERLNTPKKIKEKTSTISNNNKKVLKLNFGWPIRGRIIKNFLQSNRKGIDIIGKPGQQVYAAEAGKAVYCGHGLPGYGNLIIIKHNTDFLTAYAHNRQISVSEGQLLEKGQAIGRVSESGSKKALLHFEIRKNGQSVNPLSLLPKN